MPLRWPSYPQAGAVHLAGVEVRVVIRDQARPRPAATDRPSLSQRCGAISRRGREQVGMELKWSKSIREPISETLNHCATGVGRGTKDVLALMPTRMLGVVCGLLGHPARDGGQEIGVMRQVGRAKRLAAASSMLLVLGACSDGSDEPGNEPTATSTTTSPTPTDTETSPPSAVEVASQAAEAKVREYYDVRDQLRQDPSAPLSRLRTVAISIELAAQQRLLHDGAEPGLRPDRPYAHRRACGRSRSPGQLRPQGRPSADRPGRCLLRRERRRHGRRRRQVDRESRTIVLTRAGCATRSPTTSGKPIAAAHGASPPARISSEPPCDAS